MRDLDLEIEAGVVTTLVAVPGAVGAGASTAAVVTKGTVYIDVDGASFLFHVDADVLFGLLEHGIVLGAPCFLDGDANLVGVGAGDGERSFDVVEDPLHLRPGEIGGQRQACRRVVPRLAAAELAGSPRVEVRTFVPDLFRLHAAADLAMGEDGSVVVAWRYADRWVDPQLVAQPEIYARWLRLGDNGTAASVGSRTENATTRSPQPLLSLRLRSSGAQISAECRLELLRSSS